MQIMHVDDAFQALHAGANAVDGYPARRASSRIFNVSRTIPTELHKMSAAISSESTGSIQFWCVHTMPAPPAMTAAVESVSPAM